MIKNDPSRFFSFKKTVPGDHETIRKHCVFFFPHPGLYGSGEMPEKQTTGMNVFLSRALGEASIL